MMSEQQKKDSIQAFYEKHKDSPDLEKNLKALKEMLNYTKDDVPKR